MFCCCGYHGDVCHCSCGCDVTLMIDDLHLCGLTQLLISFDHRMSHPSMSMVTVAFKEK